MIAWLLLMFSLLLPAEAGVVDRVVLVVDEELVLESEIRLEGVITGLDRPALPFWTLDHATPLGRLEKAAVVRALASGVALYEPEAAEIEARIAAIQNRLGGPQGWRAFQQLWGLNDRAATRLMRRRIIVERYLARNVTEDPTKSQAWLSACDALLDELRPRFRIRTLPARGTP
jgi:hypothetical protein